MDTSDSAAAPGDDPGGEPSFAASPVSGAPLIGGPIEAVPAHLVRDLVPAQWVVREWERYTFVHAGAREVWIGAQRISPYPGSDSHFEVRFENQLGLATIRVTDAEGRTVRHHLEVVASKLGSAGQSVAFLRATLAALHARIAATPFVLGAATERFVRESPLPPGTLFLYHFFRNHGDERVSGWPDRAGGGGAAAGGPGAQQPRDRRAALHQPAHGGCPHATHLRTAWALEPGRGGAVRPGARVRLRQALMDL